MVRQIQIIVPRKDGSSDSFTTLEDAIDADRPSTRLEVVMQYLQDCPHAHNPFVLSGPKHDMVMFLASEKRVGLMIDALQTHAGVGLHWGRINIIELTTTVPRLPKLSDKDRFAGKKTKGICGKECLSRFDRLSVMEIREIIDAESHLTCDYISMMITGSFVAAAGLAQNSSVTVVASMLISPLMGPIMAMAFGIASVDKDMFLHALRNELIGLLITFVTGACLGFIAGPFYGPHGVMSKMAVYYPYGGFTQVATNNLNPPGVFNATGGGGGEYLLRSNQIFSRGFPWCLFSGFFVAAPSGVAVSLAFTGGGINAIIGVAIAAALLPPIVCSGFCITFSIWRFYDLRNPWIEKPVEFYLWLDLSFWSLMLFMVNLLTITLCAALTFRFKAIDGNSIRTRRKFWKKSLKNNSGNINSQVSTEEGTSMKLRRGSEPFRSSSRRAGMIQDPLDPSMRIGLNSDPFNSMGVGLINKTSKRHHNSVSFL